MMMMPSIFGGNLFNDDWMDFSFPDIDKELYGKHAKNLMKTDVKEKDGNYEVAIDLPGFKKDEITAELKDGYLTISAEKGLEKDEKDKLLIRPGISGYAQAYYRNGLKVREKRMIDAWYAHNVSFLLDVKIVFKTIETVFKHDNIYTNR